MRDHIARHFSGTERRHSDHSRLTDGDRTRVQCGCGGRQGAVDGVADFVSEPIRNDFQNLVAGVKATQQTQTGFVRKSGKGLPVARSWRWRSEEHPLRIILRIPSERDIGFLCSERDRVDHDSCRRAQSDKLSAFRQCEVGVHFGTDHCVLARSEHDAIRLRRDGKRREDPLQLCFFRIGEEIPGQIDRRQPVVVDLDPVGAISLGVFDACGTAGHQFIDADRRQLGDGLRAEDQNAENG